MTLATVQSISFIVVALTVVGNVLCSPLLTSSPVIVKQNAFPSSSLSSNRSISSIRHSSEAEEDEADTGRIVGGNFAKENQFPFMAVVHRLLGGGYVAQCGGTIISQRWVLTAGHCVGQVPANFIVVFGVNDKAGLGYNFYQGPGIAMMTNQGALHPDYQPSVNDIGLLYMPRDIPFGRTIRPIRLPGPSQAWEDFAGRMGIVIGWGKNQSTGTGTRLLKYAAIPIISNSECSVSWNIIPKKHVCTAAGYGSDACQGDSGGPLIIYKNGVPLKIGIVSYGDKDCPSSRPGVFSRVAGYIGWIQEVTGLHFRSND